MAALRFVFAAAVLATALALPPTPPTDSRRAEIEEKKRLAVIECSANSDPHRPVTSLCYSLCMFKSLGALDKDGRYVESVMADFLWAAFDLNRDQADAVAKACNTMNDHIEPGCARGRQVNACVTNETVKLAYSRSITGVQG